MVEWIQVVAHTGLVHLIGIKASELAHFITRKSAIIALEVLSECCQKLFGQS